MDFAPPSGHVVAAVFDGEEDATQALDALREAGVHPEQVSLMMSDRSTAGAEAADPGSQVAEGAASGATMGGIVGGLAGWLLGIGALAIPGIGPVLGAGVLGSILAGAAIGAAAGGLLGALVTLGIPEEEARTYESHVRAGHVLLTVHAPDLATADHLSELLERKGAYNVRSYQSDQPPASAPAPVPPPGAAPVAGTAAPLAGPSPEPAGLTVANLVDDMEEPTEPPSAETIAPTARSVALEAGPGAADRGVAAPGPSITSESRELAGPAPPVPDPQLAEATATPYRSGGEAARTADLSTVRALAPDAGDRGLDAPETPLPGVDRGPRGTDTEYRSGGAGPRGEDTHEQPGQPRPRPGGPTRE